MKRTIAAVITAVTASTLIWLAACGSADAASVASLAHAKPKPPSVPSAALHVAPKWTYQHGGKLAVIATCSERRDLRVVTSKMLRHPVILRKGGNLLIKVANKTNAGKYVITLWCVNSHHLIDARDVMLSREGPACRFRPAVGPPPCPSPRARTRGEGVRG